jgi:C4-type Zn-finger protein
MNDSERMQVTSTIACPYCHSYTFHLTFIPYAGGLVVRGVCENCGLKGESMSESLRHSMGSDVAAQVRRLELVE